MVPTTKNVCCSVTTCDDFMWKSGCLLWWCRRSLTQQGRVAVPQREALVAGNVEGRQQVKLPLQQGLQAGRRRVGWVEQVVDLLAGGTQLRHCEIQISVILCYWNYSFNTYRKTNCKTKKNPKRHKNRLKAKNSVGLKLPCSRLLLIKIFSSN